MDSSLSSPALYFILFAFADVRVSVCLLDVDGRDACFAIVDHWDANIEMIATLMHSDAFKILLKLVGWWGGRVL